MRTIYWTQFYGGVSVCKVLFATEQHLLVRTETGGEFLLDKKGENEYWFTTKEEAEAASKLITSQN